MCSKSEQLRLTDVLTLLVASVFTNYVDRGNLSIAAPLLKNELSISASQLGILLSSFFWTCTALLFVCGWFVDRSDVSQVRALVNGPDGPMWNGSDGPLLSRLCAILVPIIRRQRHTPNVLRFLQLDSAVSRLVWIDVHDLCCSAFVHEMDMNRDFHPYAQCDGNQNQSTMEAKPAWRMFVLATSSVAPQTDRTHAMTLLAISCRNPIARSHQRAPNLENLPRYALAPALYSLIPPLGRTSPKPSSTLWGLCLMRSTVNLTPSKNAPTRTTTIVAVEIM